MLSDFDSPILVILLLGMCVSALYAAILERLKHRYSPTWTWLTVVIGNALIGMMMGSFCWLSILPWRAFWLYLALNIAMGIPIIAWQIGQEYARRTVRAQRNGDRHGPTP